MMWQSSYSLKKSMSVFRIDIIEYDVISWSADQMKLQRKNSLTSQSEKSERS